METKHYKNWVKIGLNVAYYRKERGLTQQDLAEISNISRNHLQKIENGSSASVETFMNIADAMDIALHELFSAK